MSSINYNAAASSALRVLQSSNSALDATQSRISTGLKIGQAKDNAAYWSIATTMKSDNKALGTVKDALGLGAGTVDTAYQGLDAARAQLDDMKTKLTSALNPNVDREAVQKDIDAYLSSLKSIATSSVFSGENWLSVNSSVPGYSNTKQVVSSYSRDANGTVAIETIAIDTSKIALIDTNANGNGVLTSQSKLSAGGVDLAIGGNAATGPAPALAGLTGAATETKGTVDAAATTAKADLGFFNIAGLDKTDKLVFSLSVNGQAAKSVTVDLSTVTNASTFKGKVQDAIDAQFAPVSGVKQATVDIDATTGKITLQTTQTGANAAVEVTGLMQQDGDGTKTALGGLTDANGIADGTSTAAKYLGAAAVDGAPGTLNNTISFDLEVGGVKKSFSFANNNGSGTKLTAAQLITKVHDLVTATDGTGFGSAVTVADDGSGKLLITTAAKGEAQRVIVTNRSAEFDAVKLNGAETRGTDTVATYVTAAFNATGLDVNDRISFDMTLNGTTKTIVAAVAAADGDFRASIQKSIDAAFGANVIKLATSGSMDFSTVAKGDSQHLTMSNLKAVDGNGTITSTLGLANGAAQGSDATSLAKASTLTGSAFTAPITFDAQDSQSFSITVNGGAKKTVTVNKASVEAALTGQTGYVAGSGTVSSASDYAKVLQAALGTAGVTGVNVTANTTAGLDFNKIKFEAATAGAGTISIDAASVTSTSGASTISVNEISITSDSFKALTKDQQTQVINAYINVVSDKLKAVTSAASMMGSVSARIESQKTFVSNLMDTIDKGVSGLVDADMNEESTKLQALQVKQQLGVQALSIANQSAQSVLSLFRG